MTNKTNRTKNTKIVKLTECAMLLALSIISFSPSTTLPRMMNLPLQITESIQLECAEYTKFARKLAGERNS